MRNKKMSGVAAHFFCYSLKDNLVRNAKVGKNGFSRDREAKAFYTYTIHFCINHTYKVARFIYKGTTTITTIYAGISLYKVIALVGTET